MSVTWIEPLSPGGARRTPMAAMLDQAREFEVGSGPSRHLRPSSGREHSGN